MKRYWIGAAGLAAYLTLIMVFFAATLPGLLRSREWAYETSAIGSLRSIHRAAEVYRDAYANGYPATLATLGTAPDAPSCHHADQIDPVPAGTYKSGYKFHFEPGPVLEKPAAGCPPGVSSYAVNARPMRHGRTGRRSFYMDQTGAIWWTMEDRAATTRDQPLN